jgi:hypothetical protein
MSTMIGPGPTQPTNEVMRVIVARDLLGRTAA